jgi:hypothetical protein
MDDVNLVSGVRGATFLDSTLLYSRFLRMCTAGIIMTAKLLI